MDISSNQIHENDNFPANLKVCGSRVMLTANINTSDHLIKWVHWKIEYMQMARAGNDLVVIIYVKFGDVDATNS